MGDALDHQIGSQRRALDCNAYSRPQRKAKNKTTCLVSLSKAEPPYPSWRGSEEGEKRKGRK